MKQILLIIFTLLITLSSNAQNEKSYKYLNNQTYTYEEAQEVYKELAKKHERAQFYYAGKSDVGKDINVFIIKTVLVFMSQLS